MQVKFIPVNFDPVIRIMNQPVLQRELLTQGRQRFCRTVLRSSETGECNHGPMTSHFMNCYDPCGQYMP